MNLTRDNLISLIAEELRSTRSILLEEEPPPPHKSRDYEAQGEESGGKYLSDDDNNKVDLARQALFHMAQQAQQLHDMLTDGDNVTPHVVSSILDAAGDLEEAFKAITYDKQNPIGY